MRPRRLEPRFVPRVWGTTRLEPWYPNHSEKIGEVWFPAGLPVLVKFVFTSDKLSVQVHPPGSQGKTEMWHVLRAEPGAKVGLGFKEPLTSTRLREAALSGEVENLLHWIEVAAGDTIFNPAGTVHAIGAGLVLCEVQQSNDVTYRLYDYGRLPARPLHLEQAIAVSTLGPHPGKQAIDQDVLASCEYFDVEWAPSRGRYTPDPRRFHFLMALEGEGLIDGRPLRAGEVWHVPAGGEPFDIQGSARLLRACVPR